MTTISCLTPTIRPEGLDIVKIGLDRQTIPYEEWIIGSSFDPKMGKWVKDDFEGGFWTLNRCYNKILREAKGDLIVSIQDFTFFYPDALARFLFHYEKNPKSIVSGIGDKYDQVYPERGKKMWRDPRRDAGTGFGEYPFYLVEGNFCAFPRQAAIDVGGFDESMDFKGFGLDFYSMFDRISLFGGYKFYIDDANESFSLVHGRVDGWDAKNITSSQYMEIHNEYVKNPVLNYLA